MVSTLKKAYNISIDNWNQLSENAYRFSNEHYGCDHCIYTNIKHITKPNHLLLIASQNVIPIKYFDTKTEYTRYDLYQYDVIIHLLKMVEHMYIVPMLYRIKREMIQQNIHKISDSHGNYIVIYLESEKELIVEDIGVLLESF